MARAGLGCGLTCPVVAVQWNCTHPSDLHTAGLKSYFYGWYMLQTGGKTHMVKVTCNDDESPRVFCL